ncbi:Hypothetical protein R9X50_00402800 [Acrodontium crateriforme]|uniref:Zn(2)-C6 fungal-type domain-containing protein n=1 Tax=Acrodontium crateriforme TaxID=150365 RepID=A0AAQ3M5B6_9PEZI|nr:Hypothetical protein R9X50_00402800 [Acrodontium crateriforme]
MSGSTNRKRIIQIGNGSQARIAQACDRCRTKKIRCDGVEPRCSNCDVVGLECKTSHHLSRRAFPKGYTESLENHVRELEAQVAGLKSDIDVLSGMLLRSSNSSQSVAQLPSPRSSPATSSKVNSHADTPQSPVPEQDESSEDVDFVGNMCVKVFLATLKYAVEESGRKNIHIDSAINRFGLLLQSLRPESRSQLMEENQKVIHTTIGILNKLNMPGATAQNVGYDAESSASPKTMQAMAPTMKNEQEIGRKQRGRSAHQILPQIKKPKLERNISPNPSDSQLHGPARGVSVHSSINLDFFSFGDDCETGPKARKETDQKLATNSVHDLDELINRSNKRIDSCHTDSQGIDDAVGLAQMDWESPAAWSGYALTINEMGIYGDDGN